MCAGHLQGNPQRQQLSPEYADLPIGERNASLNHNGLAVCSVDTGRLRRRPRSERLEALCNSYRYQPYHYDCSTGHQGHEHVAMIAARQVANRSPDLVFLSRSITRFRRAHLGV